MLKRPLVMPGRCRKQVAVLAQGPASCSFSETPTTRRQDTEAWQLQMPMEGTSPGLRAAELRGPSFAHGATDALLFKSGQEPHQMERFTRA